MRKLIAAILFCSASLLAAGTYNVRNAKQLSDAVQSKDGDITIILETGDYDLTPLAVTDSTLGNAVYPDSMITVTTGLHIFGKTHIKLIGKDRRTTVIRTNAGYGIFIEHSSDVLIKDLTITDGIRDQDPNATSGAIVVKHSKTEITGCIIENNQGDYSTTVAGIIGICGREGADLNIHNSVIRDNSWDGIALYRKAKAWISDNLICNGRGAGIGITWDSEANVAHNVIHHFWKGIGSFGTAQAFVHNNLVRDVRGWGVIASGHSSMHCEFNEVRRAGNVGIAVWDSTASMQINNNVICLSGQEKQWIAPLVGIWVTAAADSSQISENLLWGNKEADIAFGFTEPGPDGAEFTFAREELLFGNGFLQTGWPSLNTGNYYSGMNLDLLNPQLAESLRNWKAGIFQSAIFAEPWYWDPDSEPFQD